ncbi:ABC transporter permease [Actinomarinicola tropica]|uniref:Transport permease protein n=1 Tax=Actinomarinicola tropica TaxID=2789776 RepID=A0A5Q2RH22_9ACTN|nr:ABC transporter permease [Actinomarinicola tropica]QGG95043.1 ABC transporter [Actinomarinicola tropica]
MTGRSGLVRVVEREARVFRQLWRGPVILSFVTPVLFLAGMGIGLGGMVDDGGDRDLGGLDYLEFVTPGLLVASAMQVAAGESLWPVMAGKKWMKTYHAMVATPLDASDVVGGHVAWTAIRTAMSGSAFLAVAAVLGGVPSAWAPLAVPAAVLCAAAIAALVSAFAVGQESDLAFTTVMRLGVIPLFLFSGTFFPVAQLPDGLEPLVVISPLWHGVELARGATTGQLGLGEGVAHVAALVAMLWLGWRWAARRFTRELQA